MSEVVKCEKCGGESAEGDLVAGLCPRCVMIGGMKAGAPKGFDAPAPEVIEAMLPQFEVMELLPKGGMGAVYKARQRKLERLVAIKVLPPEFGEDAQFRERFEREAKALARLSHPNIVAVYDFDEREGLFYLVMEFVDGANLAQLMGTGKLTAEQALAIVPQICDALQFAHDRRIVHRDIKPANILVTARGEVKIADFGLAKLYGETSEASEMLTVTNQVLGTPSYMAPEQRSAPEKANHRADIYSLGVVFYQMLTGELPQGVFPSPSTKVQVDVRIDEVVLHALASEPEKRYQKASEVKTDVEAVTGHHERVPMGGAKTEVLVGRGGGDLDSQAVTVAAGERLVGSEAGAETEEEDGGALGRVLVVLVKGGVIGVVAIAVWFGVLAGVDYFGSGEGEVSPDPAVVGAEVEEVAPEAEEVDYVAAMERLKNEPEVVRGEIAAAVGRLQRDNVRLRDFRYGLEVSEGVAQLDLSKNHALLDLSSLRGLPLTGLDLSFSLLEDLAPLRGMPLRELDVSETDVADLGALEGMALEVFKAARLELKSLDVLTGMPLREVDLEYGSFLEGEGLDFLRGSDVEVLNLQGFLSFQDIDVAAIAAIPFKNINFAATEITALEWLNTSELQQVTLTPGTIEAGLEHLRGVPGLEVIGMWELGRHPGGKNAELLEPEEFWRRYDGGEFRVTPASVVVDVEAAIERLKQDHPERGDWDIQFRTSVRDNVMLISGEPGIWDLTALRQLPLYGLNFSTGSPKVRDLSPLRDLPLLELLLGDSTVTDLEPLRGMPLRRFKYSGPVRDFGALLGSPLRELDLSHSGLRDLEPLGRLPLRRLNIGSCPQLKSLSPLRGFCVRHLTLRAHPTFTHLNVLEGMPLKHLNLESTNVSDLRALREMPLESLILGQTPVSDLSDLRGVPLLELELWRVRGLSDLEPLRGMPLVSLGLRESDVRDLSAIEGMGLKHMALSAGRTLIDMNILRGFEALEFVDVGHVDQPIERMTPSEFWARYSRGEFRRAAILGALEEMKAANPRVADEAWVGVTVVVEDDRAEVDLGKMEGLEDLSALEGIALTKLLVHGTDVTDLAPLRGMPLVELEVKCKVGLISDTLPLLGMPLKELKLGDRVGDLRGLEGMKLEVFEGLGHELRDISVLGGMPLRRLRLLGTSISDLSALEGKRFEELDLSDNETISDWSALERVDVSGKLRLTILEKTVDLRLIKHMSLRHLDLNGMPSPDLCPLEGMGLEQLSLRHTDLTDLAPLANLTSLTSLDVGSNQVADLAPLGGLSLKYLWMVDTPVTDLTPLAGMPLETLVFDPETVERGIEVLRGMKTLRRIGTGDESELDVDDFWELYDSGHFDVGGRIREAIEALKVANPEQEEWHAEYRVEPGKVELDLGRHPELRDISGVEGLPLTRLILVVTGVSDLSPLRGMGLEFLDIGQTQVENIDVVKDMPLVELTAHRAKALDWSPLKGKPLVVFDVYEAAHPPGLELIEGMPLKSLKLVLGGQNLTGFANLRLNTLSIDAKSIDSLLPLAGMPLTSLQLKVGPSDGDLSPLQGMELEVLNVRDGRVLSELAPLEGGPLRHLTILRSSVRDLSPLRGMRLVALNLPGGLVDDLRALEGMDLEDLNLCGCPVKDLTPLLDLRITDQLWIPGTPVADVSVLGKVGMRFLAFSPWRIEQGMEALRGNEKLEVVRVGELGEELAVAEFWRRWDAGEFREAPGE